VSTGDAIRFEEVSKVYRVYAHPRDRLIEALTGRPRHAAVHALQSVSGSVPSGAVMGLIGENGAGKSTLLKILSRTTAPTSGRLSVPGRVASILELGSSFHPEVTGRRNAVLQAALAGLTSAQTEAALPEIESFAELGDFFDRPVRTYSSGMQMRLAFSVATAVLPDVVILDEALAVGDARFQKKCIDRIYELKASGRTILFCSHALYYISTFCDEAIWLHQGAVAARGPAQSVVLQYEEFLAGKDRPSGTEGKRVHEMSPDALARVTAVRVTDGAGLPREKFRPGEPFAVEVEFRADTKERPLQIHVAVSTPDNVVCFTADSRLDGSGPFRGEEQYAVRISVDRLPLAKGEFIVYVYAGDENALVVYDARSDLRFAVEVEGWRNGLVAVPVRWERLEVPAGCA
jgi:lipopolysaccharide transport system ATP-binding protein